MVIAPLMQALQNLLNPAKGFFGGIGNLSTTVGFGTGISGFANGGIVNKATMFTFADGGAGRLGLMGEAGPEAIMPLRRGRDGRLGVQAANGGGAVSVVVNVDASGTSVQGDNAKGAEFGRAISEAVKNEIVIQKRPGGLLN
jgi:phage-related minor tail protein